MPELSALRPGPSNGNSAAENLLDMEANGVMLFHGKKYAVNLLWLTTDEAGLDSSGRKALIRSRMSLIKPDFVADRSIVISQQGYGHLRKGHRIGMPVAAAGAADLLVGEWHGAFKADNGWWYVSVHGDALAPDGDKFFTTEEEIYAHFTTAMDRQHWPRAYAPEEWSIPGTSSDITLEKLLVGIQSTYLKPLTMDAVFGNSRNKLIFMAAIGFILAMVTTFMSTGLSNYLQPIPPLHKVVTVDVADTIAAPPRYVSGPFSDETALLEIDDYPAPLLIRTCLKNFEDLFASLPGWQIGQLVCAQGKVSAKWERKGAHLADLGQIRGHFPDDINMVYDGQSALAINKELDLSTVEKVHSQVLRKEILFALLTRRLESKGDLKIAQVEQAMEDVVDPATGLTVSRPKGERYMSIEFSSPISAYLWADDFDIPGLKPLELTWSVPNATWKMTGLVQYQ